MTLHLVPMNRDRSSQFIELWHRHHKPPVGYVFAIGVADETLTDSGPMDVLVGVATVGRPVARMYADGRTLEVTRTATDGTRNVNSMLYGAAWRAAKALGYDRLITYTQAGETGASLRAAGWRVVAERRPRPGWNVPSRPRIPNGTENIARTLWEAS